ncbi:MAG: thiol peroxidase [Spirochaetes bacterium]|nr:thiol peroxidase [Spirochaetota bacterium]
MERAGIVTMRGNPVTLIGNEVKVGEVAPNFTALNSRLESVSLSDFRGKVVLISVTPSLDTPVCDLQATRFNTEANSLSDDVRILNISVDLPFALGRFCATKGIDKLIALSDHRDLSFGNAYGVVVKEFRLLARAIFIIDREGIIRYIELVNEITNHPNYEKAREQLIRLL